MDGEIGRNFSVKLELLARQSFLGFSFNEETGHIKLLTKRFKLCAPYTKKNKKKNMRKLPLTLASHGPPIVLNTGKHSLFLFFS